MLTAIDHQDGVTGLCQRFSGNAAAESGAHYEDINFHIISLLDEDAGASRPKDRTLKNIATVTNSSVNKTAMPAPDAPQNFANGNVKSRFNTAETVTMRLNS